MIFAVFLLLLLPLLIVRWARWLAIVQQKEYRFDRLAAFLTTEEGKKETFRLVPRLNDFTRTGLKRPVSTARIAIIGATSLFFGLAWLVLLLLTGLLQLPILVTFIILWYLLLPLILLLSCLPTVLAANFVTIRALKKAKCKLEKEQVKIIGIGGSYGKTSTKHLLAHLLSQKYSVFVTPKSHNTKYSVAQSILQGYTNQQIALLEYGSYKIGEIAHLAKWLPPTMAIETGFTVQHLSLFGSIENSLQAEAELVAALPLGEKVFCNAADQQAAKICEIGSAINKAQVIPYTGLDSVVKLENIQVNDQAKLSFGWQQRLISTEIVGKHYIPNIQAAIAVAIELGLSDEMIVNGLSSFQPNDSFIHSKVLANGAVYIDDGATSNPKGFSAAIELMKELPESQKILLTAGIVDLGQEAESVHQRLANEAKQVFQVVAYVGVDGHNEFETAFGDQLLRDKEKIIELIKSAKIGTAILAEGWMPKWLDEILK